MGKEIKVKIDELKRNRRAFLRSGVTGLAAAALAPSVIVKAEEVKAEPKKEVKKYPIIKRTLGRTGIKIPVISMGANSEDKALYTAALDAGLTHIDTGNSYLRGRHEELVAEVIKGRPRDSLVMCTKVYVRYDQKTGLFPAGTTGEIFLKPFEESMKRLGVKHLDILYLHDAARAGAATYGPILETMQKIKKDGKTRFLGLSVHTNEPEVIRAAADCKVYDVILTSYNFKQPHVAEVKDAIAYAAKAGLGIVAMKTQAGVFLDKEQTKPINHRAAIKWVLSDTNVHTTIPGFENFEQMELFLSVMGDLTLTPQEKADLDSAKVQAGLYCAQCGECLPQCPKGVLVPTYMRAFMYAYGYRKPGKAKETIAETMPAELPCSYCSSCKVSCVMGFDVKGRLMDVARVRNVPEEFLIA